jgi:dienelactone hydrolase
MHMLFGTLPLTPPLLLALLLALLGLTPAHAQLGAADCRPEQQGQAQLQALRPGLHTVQGPLAGFDPCQASVRFRLPQNSVKPPLMISLHGGGGIKDVLGSDQAFFEHGMATLTFDAYDMNRFTGRGSLFWARQVSNEARQRMLLSTAWAAYQWAIQRKDIDTRQIYIFGISNGAAVAANLAAMVDPQHVRGVIAEGITPVGLGLPHQTRVPLMLAFGRLDDFGAADPKMMRWLLSDPCRFNIRFELAPAGTAERCNGSSAPADMTPNPLAWVDSVKARSAPIEIAYFENMAHNAYFGPLVQQRATWGSGQTLGASLGATPEARAQFFQAMTDFIARQRRAP